MTTLERQSRNINVQLRKLQELHPHRRYGRKQLADASGISYPTISRIEETAILKLRRGLRDALPSGMFDELCGCRRGTA